MQIYNNKMTYGLISILLHWVMAVLSAGLFFLGDYMVGLDYYDSWYNLAPWWHKSLGMLVFALTVFRLIWKYSQINPLPLASYKFWEVILAKITHISFYILLIVISLSGYIIATAKGSGIDIFLWFEFPAVGTVNESQAEIAGEIHEIAAWLFMFLLGLHIVAAIKHHFIDKDNTLIRMLKSDTSYLNNQS